jgi:hypothetical protein
MLNLDLLGPGAILQPEVSDVYMPGFGSRGCSAILLKLNGAFVVLFEYVLMDLMSSGLHKHLYPYSVGQEAMPMTSASVELFVLSFCLLDLHAMPPCPNDMRPPV